MSLGYTLLFEDENILAVDKVSGISVIPERKNSPVSLKDVVEKKYGKIFVVHRIDKQTSGIVLFARNANAHRNLNRQFEEHSVKKIYVAIVRGRLPQTEGEINLPIAPHPSKANQFIIHQKGKHSFTKYLVEEEFIHASLVQVEIKTGRTHQIRVHFAYINHSLLADAVYGDSDSFYLSSVKKNYRSSAQEKPIISRLTLHSSQLQFMHPYTQELKILHAPLPADMEVLLKVLRKYDRLNQ